MKFKYILAKYAVKAGIIWPIGEEEYHACLSRKRTPVQVWYGSPFGSIAQLVEQGIEDPRVASSILALGTILGLFTVSCSLNCESA